MLRLTTTYVSTLIVLVALDALWLGLAALPMYRATLGQAMLTFRPAPGVLFYLLYAAGILVFVTPVASAGNWGMAVLLGALFGLVAYGTYDLTNYATIKVWTLRLAATDMVWGMVLTATAATLGALAGRTVAAWFA